MLWLGKVAEKVHCAIKSDNPRIRCLVSVMAYAGVVMAPLIPDFLIDVVMKKIIKIYLNQGA